MYVLMCVFKHGVCTMYARLRVCYGFAVLSFLLFFKKPAHSHLQLVIRLGPVSLKREVASVHPFLEIQFCSST